jgi:uncharacterized protein YbjQ (UPF0145 family)
MIFGRRDRSEEEDERLLLVTAETVTGWDIVEVIGLVCGAASDRDKALERMEEQAIEWNADAVVAVRLDSSASGGAFVSDREAFAYGTAVRVSASEV